MITSTTTRSSQNLEVHVASGRDAAAIAQIQNQLFYDKWNPESIQRLLTNDYALAYRATQSLRSGPTGALAGYLIAMKSVDTAEIVSFGVEKSYQGNGIGKTLMTKLIDACRSGGISEIYLEVACNNVAAISLYQDTGFQISGRRKEYYTMKDASLSTDALILSQML